MSDDLRRLAEQAAKSDRYDEDFIAYVNAVRDPQAILALLDLRDGLLVRLGQATERAKAAERRVAALEELLGQIVMEYPYLDPKHPWARFVDKARALLAAAPSEPHDATVHFSVVEASACLVCNPPAPAALPADSKEPSATDE